MTDPIIRARRVPSLLMWGGMGLLILPAVMLVVWLFDRHPPFRVLSISTTYVIQGNPLMLDIPVERDVDRDCSVLYSRYTLDFTGRRSNESPVAYMNSKGIRGLVELMPPDRLRLSYPLTTELPVGPATYVTVMDWMCNPVHSIWPIQQIIEIPLQILPRPGEATPPLGE